MTDKYDINKVSPRPWIVSGGNTIRPHKIFPAVLTISIEHAEKENVQDDLAHIVHCVNIHAALVKQLDSEREKVEQLKREKRMLSEVMGPQYGRCVYVSAEVFQELLDHMHMSKDDAIDLIHARTLDKAKGEWENPHVWQRRGKRGKETIE